MKKQNYYNILFIIILASLGCYAPTFINIPDQVYKFITYSTLAIFIILTLQIKNLHKEFIYYSILILSICQLLSAYNAYIFKGQSLSVSLLATMQSFAYILYIPLCKSQLNIRKLEKIIQIFAVGYLLCSLFNHLSPIPLFGSADLGDDRGGTRFRLVGIYWVIFFLFLKINKYAINGKNKDLWWIILSACGILLSLTRQDILVSALLGYFLFLFKTKPAKKIIFLIISATFAIFILPQIKIVDALIQKSIQDKDAQEEYDNIRIVAASYFLFGYPRNTQQILFGVGIPAFGKSQYGIEYEYEQESLRVFREDVGYCGFYYNHGLIATVLLIAVFIRVLYLKVPDEYIYLKFFSGAFLLLNIASAPSQVNLSIIPFIIMLYMSITVHNNNKNQNPQQKLKSMKYDFQ